VQYLLGIRPKDIYEKMEEAIDAILDSKIVIFINDVNAALTIDFRKPPSRSVNTPETETSLRGPREAFIEAKQTNIGLIRKRIKNINLKIEPFQIGRQTKTDVSICYIKGIANDKIVNEVRERLNKIDIDGVLANTYIEEYIEDSPFFIFPTIFRTERPDIVVGKLLEGYIAIITDGTPIALVVPYLFVDSLKISLHGNEELGKVFKIIGIALFKKDKFAGYMMGEKEIRGVQWIRNKVKMRNIVVPVSNKDKLTIKLVSAHSTVTPYSATRCTDCLLYKKTTERSEET